MQIKYDKVADAVYMSVSAGKVSKTVRMEDRLIVDMDKEGNVIGIELLDASAQGGLIKNLEQGVKKGIPVEIIKSIPELVG